LAVEITRTFDSRHGGRSIVRNGNGMRRLRSTLCPIQPAIRPATPPTDVQAKPMSHSAFALNIQATPPKPMIVAPTLTTKMKNATPLTGTASARLIRVVFTHDAHR